MSRRNRDVAVDSTIMRQQNAALVLRLIWNEKQISRADLARETGLSASTVSAITQELCELGFVVEEGTGVSSGGRRPILLGINESRASIVGIEIGASHITIVGTSLRGDVLHASRVMNPTREDPSTTLATLYELIDQCLAEPRVAAGALLGIGVAVPCPVDPESPGQLSRMILPAWAGVDLAGEIFDRYQRPVFIENDANAGALAELWWGGQDVRDLTYVKVATGVGAGFIIDGKLYRGADGSAGEIGHLSTDPRGEECICGARGCLATLVGTAAILERARGTVTARNGEPVETIQDFVKATMDGDRAALEIVDSVGNSLGAALAGVLNTLNPRIVVLGGELTALGDILFDPLRVALRRQALFSSIARTTIVASRLNDHAIAVGATALVLDAALDNLEVFPPQRDGVT